MNRHKKINAKFRSLFTFSKSERRGILWLLPLLAVVSAMIVFANRPSFEKSFLELADAGIAGGATVDEVYAQAADTVTARPILFNFDPNTATLQDFCRLGLNARTAAGIIKYRERGKRFEIPEDFAACYGVTLDDYTRLEPYIMIAERFRVKKAGYGESGGRRDNYEDGETAGEPLTVFDPNTLDADGFVRLGFSRSQAEVIVNYRESMGGFRSADDLARCYVVSERQMERLRAYIDIAVAESASPVRKRNLSADPIELNSADSASLRLVSGIGDVLVGRIMDYRRRLGGFVRKEQLAEIQGMTEANYERICKQIRVDSCEIQKIDINFASHKTLAERLGNHPYVPAKVLRKLLKQRQLKGGWSTTGDMVRENIMTQGEAERIAPYLIFVTQQ